MSDKTCDAQDKNSDRENRKMSMAYVDDAKGMAGFLLAREHRGPGDTIEAASYRVQTKYGVPATFLLRLRHREVKDILMSNFMTLALAYKSASEKIEKAYEREREVAVDPKILRFADFISGKKDEGTRR